MKELLWITKTAQSKSLSHSNGQEQLDIFAQAQRTSRRRKVVKTRKVVLELQVSSSRSSSPPVHRHMGFSARDSWNDEYSPAVRLPSPLLDHVLGAHGAWTSAERRSATYFQEVSVYKILTLQRDIRFWKGIVPRSAEAFASIHHVVVAIAATHELLFRPDSSELNRFALEQCNKALRSLLTSHHTSTSLLITSCILISAYNLLRSDVKAAERSIDSGLKMSLSADTTDYDTDTPWLIEILVSLVKQHGFKLWTPDITFQIDRTVAGREHLFVDTKFPKGPFMDVRQVLAAFRTMMVEHVANLLRNLALGAHIDPASLLAQDTCQNFSNMLFHWESYYRSLSESQVDEKLQLIQLKIGFLSARTLFLTKVLESNELQDDAHIQSYAEISHLGEEVVAARHAGRPVIYLDRIVNGALYMSALFCRDPMIKRQLANLLKSQLVYVDGLVNFLRGQVAEIVAEIEEHGLIVNNCYDIPEDRRVRVALLHCREDRVLCVEYMQAAQTDRLDLKQHWSRLSPMLDSFSLQEIDDCLKGMTAAYTMYRKVDLQIAPDGYLRKMYYGGNPVRVTWRADLIEKLLLH